MTVVVKWFGNFLQLQSTFIKICALFKIDNVNGYMIELRLGL